MIKAGWFPPISPHGLIQEHLWPNEWYILVACLMLNCTTRKQVEKVLPGFITSWPTPQALLAADPLAIESVIKPLGFGRRRTAALQKLADAYLNTSWTDSRQLPGVGEYAGRAHDIFCRGLIGAEPPNDHALVDWWNWYTAHHTGTSN